MSCGAGTVKCKHYEPVSVECAGCKQDYSREVGCCSVCNNFRSNCHTDTCPECKDVPYEFYCAIDKHNINSSLR